MSSKGYKRAGGRKRKGGKVAKGATVASVRRALASIAEKKWVDHIFADYDFYAVGGNALSYRWRPISKNGADTLTVVGSNQDNLCGCVQGTGQTARNGVKIMAKYLVIKLICEMGRGGGAGGQPVPWGSGPVFNSGGNYPYGLTTKFAVVLDRDPNGSAGVTPSDIWTTDNAAEIGFASQRNHDYTSRFRILKEFKMSMAAGVMCPCSMEVFVPLNLEIEFSGGNDNMASVLKNRVQLYRVQNQGVLDDSIGGCYGSVRYRGECRMVFQDL